MMQDRKALVRKAIEEAKPAEEYFAERMRLVGNFTNQELKSISALVAYVAHTQQVSEELIASMLAGRFGADDVSHVERRHYDAVIRYLVDLNPKEQIN